MSTDHTSGMPPVDAFSGDAISIDAGNFVSESGFPFTPQSVIAGPEPGDLIDPTTRSTSMESVTADSGYGQTILDSPMRGILGGDDFGGPPSTGAMEFRVIRSGLPVRRLRLTGNRYTFGSAEGCSIQLNDPSLRPMHAVLIRDASRILVRAYSVPIELNDTRTTEANLRVGDVVRIGAYSFELLTTSLSQYDHGPIRSHGAPTNALNAPLSDDPQAWREQLRREVAQWRARQAECDRRENRCADRESVLRNRESELWSRAEQLHRRESHLMSQESAALQIQEDYANKQRELTQLRDENRAKQQAFAERETEFRSLEREYREHVEEASRQLQQSQQQAEAATQAVQRMRDQFEDLNQQLEELQGQQSTLQDREQRQSDEHRRLRLELEAARDEAIDGQAEAEARRHEIEVRVDELEEQLREAQAGCDAERSRAEESESIAEQLRGQVEQLNENLRQASDEATQLREDYKQACDSVCSLESIIEQGNSRGEMDRESWFGEAEELRQSVEQLSIDLAQANGQLSDLRLANEKLTQRLDDLTDERDEARGERDEARSELDSRPTQDAIELLRDELKDANDKFAVMQRDYEDTLQMLERSQQDLESSREEKEAAQQWAADAEAKLEANQSQENANEGLAGASMILGSPMLDGATDEVPIESKAWGFDQSEPNDVEEESSGREPIALHEDLVEQESGTEDEAVAQEDLLVRDGDLETEFDLENEVAAGNVADNESIFQDQTGLSDDVSDDGEMAQDGVAASGGFDDEQAVADQPSSDHESVDDENQGWPTYDSGTDQQVSSTDDAPSVGWETVSDTDASNEDSSVYEHDAAEQADPHASAAFGFQDDAETESGSSVASEIDPSRDSAPNAFTDDAETNDDLARWSPEPSQSTEPPHFETGEVETWGQTDEGEVFEAEFDRGTEANASNETDSDSIADSWASANESVDNAIDLIEKNVDEAISFDVADAEDQPTSDSASNDTMTSDAQTGDTATNVPDSSPWGHDANVAEEDASQTYGSDVDVTSAWDADSALENQADTDSDSEEDDSSLVSQWQTFQDEQSGHNEVGADEAGPDESESRESLGLADQLINDLNSDASDVDGEASVEHTSQWEPTQPFSPDDSMPGMGSNQGLFADASAKESDAAGQNGWDQEYPEESRSSEWTNDVEGDHTELIRDSAIESALRPGLGGAFGDPVEDVAGDEYSDPAESSAPGFDSGSENQTSFEESASVDQPTEESSAEQQAEEPPEEEDDSIEAYMNRLLNRVQGSSGTETSATQSTPLVASSNPDEDGPSDTTASTTDPSASMHAIEPDAPLVPRSQAPERNSDLSAMRELANTSARSAVARSVRIQARDTQIKAIMKFGQAAVAAGCAFACFTFLDWSVVVKSIMVVAILVISGILVQEGLVLLKEAKRRLHAAEKGGDEAGDADGQVESDFISDDAFTPTADSNSPIE